jgi:hypothetical protein
MTLGRPAHWSGAAGQSSSYALNDGVAFTNATASA